MDASDYCLLLKHRHLIGGDHDEPFDDVERRQYLHEKLLKALSLEREYGRENSEHNSTLCISKRKFGGVEKVCIKTQYR